MEEDDNGFLSTMADVLVRAEDFVNSSDALDFSTIQSYFVVDMINTFRFEDEDECNTVIRIWYWEIYTWLTLKILEADIPNISFPTERDDRVITLTYYAAYMSAELVIKELHRDVSYHYCGARRTIKSIYEALLTCFDLLCKNLLIERSWDAVGLRDTIIKAADLATDYLSSHGNQLYFPPDDNHDFLLQWFFHVNLTGRTEKEDVFPKTQPFSNAMDDDIVGLSGDIMKIKERLVRSQSNLDIIPIVGMGGIGKTTLTRKIYEDPEIMTIFHVRAWVVISQKFCERDVLLGLLESIAPLPNKVYKEDTEKLAEILYRRLKGWRYFIVLDDIWTSKAWDHIKLCFPDDNNGSRIILTSRIIDVASHVDPENPPHSVNFLSIKDSWDLLCKKVYGKNACPHQLINSGMQIAEKCQGLPLAIEVMAGHLSNISKTKECWEDVAKRMGFPTEVSHMKSLTNILSISYNDLPHHLKACFLAMVNFPKNFEIPVRKLIRLWAAMGFLPQKLPNSVEDSTVEEVASKCLKNLIDRSLIMVKKKKFDGKAKLCGIHDHLWDLGMREFRKEGHHIFCDKSFFNSNCMSVCDDDRKYVMGICQTLLCFDQFFESSYPINFEVFKQLRVLDILNQAFEYFPMEIIGLTNLRYLALTTSGTIPDLICNLSNLETLVNYHEGIGHILPKEIWLLACLRHLHVGTCSYLSEPPSGGFEGSCEPLLNLQSISDLSFSSCTKEVFTNIPNLKQLGISEFEEDYTEDELLCCALENIVNLHQLENLKLCCNSKLEKSRGIPDWCSFLPNTIKKLTLSGSNLPWSEMNALATLPNLEVLKLKKNAFKGAEWEMEDEEFLKLKYLLLESLNVIFWKANSDNFPNLQWLHIRGSSGLLGIPLGFGEIYSLELIDMEFCDQLVYDSAKKIQREQMSLGNDKLILRVDRGNPQVQMMGFAMLFVWLAMQLNIFKPRRAFQIKNTLKLNIYKPQKDCRKKNKGNPF